MIEIGRGFYVGIKEGVSLVDIINEPHKHHWLVGWEFPDDKNRNRRATPTGKSYGSDKTFQVIYDSLKDDFISLYFDNFFLNSDVAEYGEELLSDLSTDLRILVNSYTNQSGEVREFERRWDIDTTRLQNAQDRFETYWEQANERIDSINEEIDYLTSTARLTMSGNIDRRTREAHQIGRLQREKMELWAESDRLERNMNREQKRASNTYNKYQEAMNGLRYLQQHIDAFDNRFEDKAEEFARRIKEDIISKGMSGVLPTQNIPLMEKTIRNRRYAGLPETPRYWATGQLIRSIIITCQLV